MADPSLAATAALYVTRSDKAGQSKSNYPLDEDNKLSSAGQYRPSVRKLQTHLVEQAQQLRSNMQTLVTYLPTQLSAWSMEKLKQAPPPAWPTQITRNSSFGSLAALHLQAKPQ